MPGSTLLRQHHRGAAALGCLCLLIAPPVQAQVTLESLQGTWIRVSSNNDPNDQMRILVDGTQATLTRVPATVHSAFRVGQALWVGIGPDGSLRVRGSDGSYYPGQLRLEGDVLHLSIRQSAAGNDQVWQRAGVSLDGDWVRIAPGDPAVDGIRIRVSQDEAAVRFLPGEAPAVYRIGRTVWRGIAAGGSAEVLGTDGRFQSATLRLEGSDRVWVEGAGRPAELWVRPSIVTAARANPAGAGPVAPACVSTSRPGAQQGRTWWWHVRAMPHELAPAERIGLVNYAGLIPLRTGLITDLEVATFPGLMPNFTVLYEEQPTGVETIEHRNLTATELETRSEEARRRGFRATDIEAYSTAEGVRYAGVWVTNPEGIEWSIHFGLTAEAYGTLFSERRSAGDRLVDVEALPTSAGIRYAAVWHRSCDGDNWRQFRDMTRADYSRRQDSLSAEGFRVVDFESYRTSAGQRYMAIWERVSGLAWAVRTDRTLPEFLNYHRRHVDEGFRLVDFESYQTAEGVRYAGIWAENHARYRLPVREALDATVETYRGRWRIPGISVAIIQNGEVIYRRGFGWADSARRVEAHSGTIYLTASIAKAIGGTLAARLEERGVIDLSRTTRSYLSDLDAAHRHTVEQLLSKTGCVVHYAEGPEPREKAYTSQREAFERVQDDWILPNCTRDQQYHYSTHGFTLLGAALEAATGKPLRQLIDEEIAGPAGLSTLALQQPYDPTHRRAPEGRPYHMAEPYTMDTTSRRPQPSTLTRYEDASWKILGGGLRVTTVDLARFGEWTLNRALSGPVRDNRLWGLRTAGLTLWGNPRRNAPPTALAWEVPVRSGQRRVAEHGGTAPGARTYLTIYRDLNLVVAVMSNQVEGMRSDAHPVRDLAHRLADVVQNPPR